MLIRRSALLFGGLVLAVAALIGCGGDTTTIVERTVTVQEVAPEKQSTPPAAEQSVDASSTEMGLALLKLTAYEHWLIEPVVYGLGVSGSVVGRDLIWSDWGADETRASARISIERPEAPNEYYEIPGEVVATGLEACGGHSYYSQILFLGEGYSETSPVGTPCNGGASFNAGAVTSRAENEAELGIED